MGQGLFTLRRQSEAQMRRPGNRHVSFPRSALWSAAALAVLGCFAGPARAALQITEIMFDPGNEDVWEWIEVRNTGPDPVNLHGALAGRLDDPNLPDATPFIDSTLTTNTIIPVGGVAVLFDADLPGVTNADYLDQVFRDAWGLSGSVPLVGVRAFPELINTESGGGSVGFWADSTNYGLDLVPDGMGGLKVGGFAKALFSIDYRTGFPAGDNMSSITWNGNGGNGGYQDGANWQKSTVAGGAATSVLTYAPGDDVANPGIVPGGTAPSGITITEVLYHPAPITESTWEWIEIYNNTGNAIDFENSPYVFDDLTGGILDSANINSGAIPDGGVAILFNGTALSPAQIQGAWDPTATKNINFIPVTSWPGLSNTGETIALWSSLSAYEMDAEEGRATANAEAVLAYGAGGDWPPDTEGASIYLESLAADPNDGGANWNLSQGDDQIGSFYASNVTVLHAGGDVGTPGMFVAGAVEDADFDNDNDVDGDDFLIWQRGYPTGSHAEGDANEDNLVNAADLTIWESQYGSAPPLQAIAAVPEPASVGLVILALLIRPGRLRHGTR